MSELKTNTIVESAAQIRLAQYLGLKQQDTTAARPSNKIETPKRGEEVDVEQAVKELNDFTAKNSINLAFSVDKATGRTIIKIIDVETEKVVRQLPPEELLAMSANLEELAGHLLNAKA